MAWDLPSAPTTLTVITQAWGQQVSDSLAALSLHTHSGAAGDGDDELVGVDSIEFDDISDPAAPGADDTIIWSNTGKLHQRAGAAGAAEEFSVEGHVHTLSEIAQDDLHTWAAESGAIGNVGANRRESNTANNTWDLQERVTYTPTTAKAALVISGHACGFMNLASDPTHEGFHTRIVVGAVEKATTTIDNGGSQDNVEANSHWVDVSLAYTMIDGAAAATNYDFERKMEHWATSPDTGAAWFLHVGLSVQEIGF